MEKPLIMVSSVTYAMKGKQILNNAGIRCEIERTQKRDVKNGCGYSLYVPQNADEAEKILKENNIKIIGRSERRNQK